MPKNWVKPLIEHGKWTKYLYAVWHPENLVLGERVDIGAGTVILAHNGVTIEDDVQIGNRCGIISKSTIDGKDGPVVIKKGARIGMASSIMPGVTIGENAIVAAHSFVTKNVKANTVVYGVPAR
jgi:acetyltransferase-like isoleucine patch superfamily enzyme